MTHKQNKNKTINSAKDNTVLPLASDFTMTAHPTLGWVRKVRLYECPFCLKENLPELANFCPNCGGKFDWEHYTTKHPATTK